MNPLAGRRGRWPWRAGLWVLAGLLLAAGLLLFWLPARWALSALAPPLGGYVLQEVSGSVWHGQAGSLLAPDGRELGRLRWDIPRTSLVRRPVLRLALAGSELAFSARLARIDVEQWRIDQTQAEVPARLLAALPALAPLEPRGKLQVTIEHAVLQGGWPLELAAQATWREAVLRTPAGPLRPGTLRLAATARAGVVGLRFADAGDGALAVTGSAQLSPLGWRLDSVLAPRQTDPSLAGWLARLGSPAADGSVRVERRGGLGAWAVETKQAR